MLWVHPGRLDLWTTNQQFREAVNWSIDREALVRDLVKGQSKVMTSFLPHGALYHVDQSPAYTFDLEKARASLEAAGVSDGGPEFELWGATGFQPRAKEVVEAIADRMTQVGLKPKIVLADVSGVIDDIFSENGTGLMYHLSWSSSGDPHAALQPLASPFVWSDGDPKIDELVQAGAATTNPEERAAVYAELQQYFWQKLPHVPLYNSDFTIAHSKQLTGLRVLPNFNTDFYPARLEA
jgi:peptide/nickel transport system substrate-binding protein